MEGLDASFFRHLLFAPRIRRAAAAIEQTSGDRDLAAVHLFQGSCQRRTEGKSPGACRGTDS
jgi:hypothetical protein